MRVSRRGVRPAAASLEVTAGASSPKIISETPGARCEIYAGPLMAPHGLIHTQILRIDALNTVDVSRAINDTMSPVRPECTVGDLSLISDCDITYENPVQDISLSRHAFALLAIYQYIPYFSI